ncbi:low molecular weight phosphatase family protein [Acuticoccus sp. I52.16.1]|uniref:low molecular weight phosphatase family protein n=1 Tax=Acuticoccus sp. I52.16.1 TaxID=2928472 RepID=UPI001FD40396|nr:low molecular weight phosphatase family protein [Acuticoccus sp. I52.16.1]UOM32899.1 low molecular weight phosphatase family protein [Acuticoccus sp. I52.16.1]
MSVGRTPTSVLFVCRHNAIRSPMAAALARHAAPTTYIRSAGLETGQPDPFAVSVMAEKGLDISKRRPRSLEELNDTSFDLVVTLAPEAHHHVLDLARTQSFDVVYWPTLDPSGAQGSREQILESYRQVRDALGRQVEELFAQS